MKTFLIAAGLAAATFSIAAPAFAQDMRSGTNQTRSNDQGRRDRGTTTTISRDGQQMNRGGRRDGATDHNRFRDDQRTHRGYDHSDRGAGWNSSRCHNVRRYHRWVRVCSGRR